MGKRSNFQRRPMDSYATPFHAVRPLAPFLADVTTYAELCSGDGWLISHLKVLGLRCVFDCDLVRGVDALTVNDINGAEAIITNPPWTRWLLHAMILHFQSLAPTWLLFDADWAFTKQAAPFLDRCSNIVAVGRVRWQFGSDTSGKDNAAWYRFDKDHSGGPHFTGLAPKTADVFA